MKLTPWIAATAIATTLAGCAGGHTTEDTTDSADQQARSAEYVCQDGSQFTVIFDSPETAKVEMHGDTFELERQRSGSGMAYASANGQHQLRGKGNEATWTVGRRMPVQCETSA